VTPSRIWPLLAGKYAPEDVLSRWRDRLGDEFPRARPLMTETGHASLTWACGREREGCSRLVHRYDDHVAAACGATFDRCARVVLDARDMAIWRLDERLVVSALRRALRIDGEGAATDPLGRTAVLLGQRAVAGVPIRFYLARHADRAICCEVADGGGCDDDGIPVLLAYSVDELGVADRARARGLELVDLAAAGAVLDAGEIVVDLDAVFRHHRRRFVGLDPATVLSARKRLIIDCDSGRVWFDRQLVRDNWREGQPFRLLVALARHPRVMVNRRRLYPEIWEEGWNRGKHDQYAAIIRPLRTAIGSWAKTIIVPTAGNDDQGGWTLNLDREEVELWSEPPPFKQPVQQRKGRK
jgi:hypothetical protein